MSTLVRSHAKINLGLAIGPTRPDGFHGLVTIYQTLAVHDELTVEAHAASKTAIRLTTNDPRVPTDNRNTAWRMVEAGLAAMKQAAEVHIHIEKNLPVQGGLGAGSANAAAALVGLERELDTRLPGELRLELAAAVGSDVPLFLIGGTVLGLSRGEEVYPLPDLPATWCVVASPAVGVSTPQAFRDWDARHGGLPVSKAVSELTTPANSDRLRKLGRTLASGFVPAGLHSSGVFSSGEDRPENPLLALVRTGIENDFEEVVFSQHPSLGLIKRTLAVSGESASSEDALYAALSGSGSALFGLYETQVAAQAALERLQAQGVAGFLTRTIPREQYWREMVSNG
ncbi:MAG TPA: 4-(cytidine 5'-diphospho)-2-C-methyl-D-erythritol kinase [Acidisarcina sp.]|nr:4-(cytidine 5'-diphospho)-2-C-methyl-D-erythritol kinase [Acidisarcina sp.]